MRSDDWIGLRKRLAIATLPKEAKGIHIHFAAVIGGLHVGAKTPIMEPRILKQHHRRPGAFLSKLSKTQGRAQCPIILHGEVGVSLFLFGYGGLGEIDSKHLRAQSDRDHGLDVADNERIYPLAIIQA